MKSKVSISHIVKFIKMYLLNIESNALSNTVNLPLIYSSIKPITSEKPKEKTLNLSKILIGINAPFKILLPISSAKLLLPSTITGDM